MITIDGEKKLFSLSSFHRGKSDVAYSTNKCGLSTDVSLVQGGQQALRCQAIVSIDPTRPNNDRNPLAEISSCGIGMSMSQSLGLRLSPDFSMLLEHNT